MVLMILLGLAAWIATSTIVEAEVFRDVREACDKCHDRFNNWFTYKLRYLVHCHMCTGIWVSAVIALFVTPIIATPFVGWALTALTIKGIAHLLLVVQKLGESITDNYKSQSEMNQAYIDEHGAESEMFPLRIDNPSDQSGECVRETVQSVAGTDKGAVD